MPYSTDILRDIVQVLNRTEATQDRYGLDASGVEFEQVACVHAFVDWAKGKTALNAGSLDAYAVVLIRMRYNTVITMRSRIVYNSQTYQIIPETFHADKHNDTIQFNAQLIIND